VPEAVDRVRVSTPMRTSRTSDIGPILAILGGLLILGESLLFNFAFFGGIGLFGIFAGLAIMGLAVAVRVRPRFRRELGAAILLLSLASFFGVSGYILGALLGVVGGIVLIASYGSPFPGSPVSVYSARASGTAFSIGASCERCGKPVPGWTGTCPYCGFPER
jgi:hypothetical protein